MQKNTKIDCNTYTEQDKDIVDYESEYDEHKCPCLMKEVDRTGTHSAKIDGIKEKYNDPNMICLGCADFDWECPKEITQALVKRAQHRCYGYTQEHQQLKKAYIDYANRHYNVQFNEEEMFIVPGLVPGIAMWLHALLTNEDPINKSKTVLMIHPEYPPYEKICIANNYQTDFVHMCFHEDTKRFTLCFKQLEEKMKSARVVLFSSPHNPTSNVFTAEELQKIVDLAKKYHVTILSDEIWADICFKKFTSILHIETENVVSFFSTSKTFNCAGLQMGITVTKDEKLINLFKKEQAVNWMYGSNVFGIAGNEAALTKCDYYIKLFKDEIYSNYRFVKNYLEEKMPKITLAEFESTTLLYLNFEQIFATCDEAFNFCLSCDVYLQPGSEFCNQTKPFLRMNIGSKQHVLQEALDRIKAKYDRQGF